MSTGRVGERLTGGYWGGVDFVQNPNHDAGFLVKIGYLIFDFLSRETRGINIGVAIREGAVPL